MRVDISGQYPKHLKKNIELGNKRILEIGCGRGAVTKSLTEGKITAIDPDPEAVAYVRKTFSGVDARVGIAEKLDFPDESFDIVVFSLSFHHVPTGKMGAALNEAHRVLKKNGMICFIEVTEKGSFLQCELLYFDEQEERREAYRHITESGLFKHVSEESFMVEWEWDSHEDYYKTEIEKRKRVFPKSILEKVRHILDRNMKNGRIVMDAETVMITAKKSKVMA